MPFNFKNTFITAIVLYFSYSVPSFSETDLSDKLHNVQYKRLTAPSERQKTHEERGKVYVYIGMKDKVVDKMMDTYFERIENFTFFSVLTTDKNEKPLRNTNGELILESDDC